MSDEREQVEAAKKSKFCDVCGVSKKYWRTSPRCLTAEGKHRLPAPAVSQPVAAQEEAIVSRATFSKREIGGWFPAKPESPQAEGGKSHEHKFFCPNDQQQCDTECRLIHSCSICSKTRADLESQPSSPAGSGKVFDELWKLHIEEADGVEVEPSPEEKGFALWSWNMASGDYANGYIDGREAGYHSCGSCSHAWESHDGECGAYMPDGSICGCTWVKSRQQSQPVIEPIVDQEWIDRILVETPGEWNTHKAARELQQFRKAQKDLGK